MDFLDPRLRRAHSIRLIIGYCLMAIVIALGAYLLVSAANGYSINTKTGQIIQNGLLFVDSQPGGATIFLNGKTEGSKTSSRLILPAGNYTLALKKDGYRDWTRTFTLSEHAIARYVYPVLFPEKPTSTPMKNYTATPPLISQSPDRKWLLVESPDSSGTSVSFDQYDTTNLKNPPRPLVLPANLLTVAPAAGNLLKEVEWSTDNKNVLLQHVYKGGSEFIVFDRDAPASSFNINKLFKATPSEVTLRNKKIDQLYIFNQKTGDLLVGNTANSKMTPLLKHVLAFKSYGSNLINYVTGQGSKPGEVSARIWDGKQSYPLYSFSAGRYYLIDEAQFQGHFYFVAGSNTDELVNVFKDPLNGIKSPSIGKALPLLSLNIKDASKVSFSTNARFIAAQAGQELSVYDIEAQAIFHRTLTKPMDDLLHWMDGHRLIGTSGGSVFVTDYDSTNQQILTPTLYTKGAFFDNNYRHMFTLPAKHGVGVTLQDISLLAGADAPNSN